MSEASETIARQVRNAVRETVSARRIEGSAEGGWTEKGIDQILFRGSHDIMRAPGLLPEPGRPRAHAERRPVHAPGVPRNRRDRGAIAGGEGWLPTAENVNALPEGIGRYVHDLETRCDPAGDVQTIALQADTIRGLHAKVRELEAELASMRRKGERGQ